MSATDTQVGGLLAEVWSSVLAMEAMPIDAPGASKGERAKDRDVSACVQISGGWEGAVSLRCSGALARDATAAMFGVDAAAATDDEIKDAVGELVNIVGGNFKALLGNDCKLSLPTVAIGFDLSLSHPGSTCERELWFESGGQPITLSILRRADDRSSRGGPQ